MIEAFDIKYRIGPSHLFHVAPLISEYYRTWYQVIVNTYYTEMSPGYAWFALLLFLFNMTYICVYLWHRNSQTNKLILICFFFYLKCCWFNWDMIQKICAAAYRALALFSLMKGYKQKSFLYQRILNFLFIYNTHTF